MENTKYERIKADTIDRLIKEYEIDDKINYGMISLKTIEKVLEDLYEIANQHGYEDGYGKGG